MAKFKIRKEKNEENENLSPEQEMNGKESNTNGNGEEQENESGESAKIEALLAELAEANDSKIRLFAEFDNFRKRSRKEKEDLLKYSSEQVMTALIPVVDDFGRTLKAMEKSDNIESIKAGIRMVSQNMSHILSKQGLVTMECIGKKFDAQFHEAITTVPVGDEAQKDMVIDEIEKGYLLHDKVIRYAKVVVGE